MNLSEILPPAQVVLNIPARKKDDLLEALVEPLALTPKARTLILRMLHEREKLGSTGIGKSIAVPHCRSLLLGRLSVVVGRTTKGIGFEAIDDQPVSLFFLIVAPPRDPGNQYLLTLGRIAQIARSIRRDDRLFSLETPEDFLQRLFEIERRLK
jgi:mannitol/fructose-specific phosphotransferase system IIA component (Ntr-type)